MDRIYIGSATQLVQTRSEKEACELAIDAGGDLEFSTYCFLDGDEVEDMDIPEHGDVLCTLDPTVHDGDRLYSVSMLRYEMGGESLRVVESVCIDSTNL